MYIPPEDDVVMHEGREDKGLGGKVNLNIGLGALLRRKMLVPGETETATLT